MKTANIGVAGRKYSQLRNPPAKMPTEKLQVRTSSPCALCLKSEFLCKSHLIPRQFYQDLRDPSRPNPNPIIISGGEAIATSFQYQKYLLCAGCEALFNNKGERWVLASRLREGVRYPLYEYLIAKPPLQSDETKSTYSGLDLPDVDVEALSFFAASVFWRAAITNWSGRVGESLGINLGPYAEAIGKFLLHGDPFPRECMIHAFVCEPNIATGRVSVPHAAGRINGMRNYQFIVPGLVFWLTVAKHLNEEDRSAALIPSSERIIILSNQPYIDAHRRLERTAQGASPKGSLKPSAQSNSPR